MRSKISAIATAVPEHKISQKEALDFMVHINEMDRQEAHNLEVLYRASGINNRYTVIEDYKRLSEFSFFPNSQSASFPTTKERMDKYKEDALTLSMRSVQDCLKKSSITKGDLTHLITVTCTGLHAPGLDLDLVQKLDLPYSIERTNINFMGCYAAFNALKVADAICQAKDSKVLVVCTELCTLHFQKGKSEDDLLANALFGDGSAAALIESTSNQKQCLCIEEYKCDILPSGKKEMTWGLGPLGFEMKLSSYVPDVIENGIQNLLGSFKSSFDHYAIHPGGKKILRVIEEALGISRERNAISHSVLKNYGNMSSPTILFILDQILARSVPQDRNKDILAMAFGPGITLESMILKVKTN